MGCASDSEFRDDVVARRSLHTSQDFRNIAICAGDGFEDYDDSDQAGVAATEATKAFPGRVICSHEAVEIPKDIPQEFATPDDYDDGCGNGPLAHTECTIRGRGRRGVKRNKKGL